MVLLAGLPLTALADGSALGDATTATEEVADQAASGAEVDPADTAVEQVAATEPAVTAPHTTESDQAAAVAEGSVESGPVDPAQPADVAEPAEPEAPAAEGAAGHVAAAAEAVAEEVQESTEAVAEDVGATTEAVAEDVAATTEAVAEDVAATTEAVAEDVAATTAAVVEATAEQITGSARDPVAQASQTGSSTLGSVAETTSSLEETARDAVEAPVPGRGATSDGPSLSAIATSASSSSGEAVSDANDPVATVTSVVLDDVEQVADAGSDTVATSGLQQLTGATSAGVSVTAPSVPDATAEVTDTGSRLSGSDPVLTSEVVAGVEQVADAASDTVATTGLQQLAGATVVDEIASQVPTTTGPGVEGFAFAPEVVAFAGDTRAGSPGRDSHARAGHETGGSKASHGPRSEPAGAGASTAGRRTGADHRPGAGFAGSPAAERGRRQQGALRADARVAARVEATPVHERPDLVALMTADALAGDAVVLASTVAEEPIERQTPTGGWSAGWLPFTGFMMLWFVGAAFVLMSSGTAAARLPRGVVALE